MSGCCRKALICINFALHLHKTLARHLRSVKEVFLSAICFPCHLTQAAGVQVTKHHSVSCIGHQEAVLIDVDTLYLVVKTGLQHYTSACM